MNTIFKISGGGQKVKQNVEMGEPVKYEVVENSDWPEKTNSHGQDFYTNYMWSTELEDLQKWANAWAGVEVELIQG